MFVRRRPLLRAAVVGGGAYAAGRRRAQRSSEQAAQEAGQDERLSDLERQHAREDRPGAESGGSVAEQLQQLSVLHERGVLSDEEFAAAKSRLLGT